MRIIVWGINYAPELTGIGPYNAILCDYLAERGHDVEMVTSFPYYPAWQKSAGDEGRYYGQEQVGQVHVHRCWHYVPRQATTFRRIIHEATFVATSFLRLLTLPAADVVVVISPPLLIGAAAWLLRVCKGSPFVFHVQDLQPDAAEGLGMVRNGWLLNSLRALERCAYQKAARVSGISRGMLEAFRTKNVPAEKTVYFPNPLNVPDSTRRPAPGAFRRRHGIAPDEFLAVYSGNLGRKQGLSVLVEAAVRLKTSRVRVVICGEGNQRSELEALCRQLQPAQLLLLPLQPADAYEELMVDTDLCLITQQPGTGPFFLPSKLLAALAYGKPVLSVADEQSDLVRLMVEGKFGLNIAPGQPQQLADALADLSLDAERLRRWGQAGRACADQFSRESVLSQIELVLQQVGAAAPSTKAPPFPRSLLSGARLYARRVLARNSNRP